MANEKTILKFYRGAAPQSPAAGMIWFDKENSTIKVYTGTAWESYAGKLIDATWNETAKALTLVKQDGSSKEISFADVASAAGLDQEIKDRKAADAALDGRVKTLESATHVDSLGGKTGAITVDGVGSGDYKVKLAMTDQKLGATIEGLGTAAGHNVEDFDAAGAAADVKSKVVNTISVGDGLAKSGAETSPKIDVVIDPASGNALSKSAAGLKVTIPAAAEYSIVKEAASSDYAAVYHLTKNGTNVGTSINIPKDMVVKSGAVVTNPEGQKAGTYIVLTLANATEDKIYIPVDSLIEYVTSGSAADDMVVVNVSPDDHKVTATITDGKVTKAKLDVNVQASLGLADTAVQGGEGVSAEGAYLSTTVQKVDKKLKVSAALKVQEMSTASAAAKGLAEASDVKSYVAGEIAKVTKVETLDSPDEAKSGQFVTAVSQTDGIITVSRAALAASDIPEIGIAKVTGLQAALDGKATSAQGAKADTAIQEVTASGDAYVSATATKSGTSVKIKVDSSAMKTYVDNKIANNTDLVWASFE